MRRKKSISLLTKVTRVPSEQKDFSKMEQIWESSNTQGRESDRAWGESLKHEGSDHLWSPGMNTLLRGRLLGLRRSAHNNVKGE